MAKQLNNELGLPSNKAYAYVSPLLWRGVQFQLLSLSKPIDIESVARLGEVPTLTVYTTTQGYFSLTTWEVILLSLPPSLPPSLPRREQGDFQQRISHHTIEEFDAAVAIQRF